MVKTKGFVFIDFDWIYWLLSWTQTPDTKQLHISLADQIIIKTLTVNVIICPPKCDSDRKWPVDVTISLIMADADISRRCACHIKMQQEECLTLIPTHKVI